MIFTRTVTVDGVMAEVVIYVNEIAITEFLAPRAMGNKTARTSMSKYVPGEVFGGKRTTLIGAEVVKASKRLPTQHSDATPGNDDLDEGEESGS